MTTSMRLSDVIGAMSAALDITEGQPAGHAVRTCLIGMRLADVIGLEPDQRSSLFYALLLKDAGCSANASKTAALFGHDDRAVKFDRKLHNQHKPLESLKHLTRNTRPGESPLARGRQLLEIVRHGAEGSRALTELRCERGADIALKIGLDEHTAGAIRALDEHWDGNGSPFGMAGDDIPLLGRILCLAQTVEVFHAAGGRTAALDVARDRRGTWFDPELVDALLTLSDDAGLWLELAAEAPETQLAAYEPAERVLTTDAQQLDQVAEAFAMIVDAKSPYTARHSDGVARIAGDIARTLGFSATAVRDLRRAALLHDVGKLGVSNTILDKPGKLDPTEWAQVKRHPELTWQILSRVPAFRSIALDAAAHHERLDGGGYHLGLPANRLTQPARILAVADVAEALSAERPYREALPADEVLRIMRLDAGTKLDAAAFAALEASFAGSQSLAA
jgi:HD-GYP domain-containing protein (c-di-GMP phosphodiesterase class II)